ncbi:MAG TPA: FAD-dependent oxidoreductase [Saprospiraceae bacterium]|nr:FAD-dependent oxidoreductase [Saprospiraceae bacterium]HMQ82565.1 FAD-dependent oxidoreductase [Saprospiraceae bacterium]
MNKRDHFDFLIVGGGIFGVYAAIYLAKQGVHCLLLEKENALFKKASIVNQARLHSGYHYPRSVATALMSDENKERFTHEHRPFINFEFEKFYAIDKLGSFTDSRQFQRFCDFLHIQCEAITGHPAFNMDRLEALFKTTEYTFDPILIARHYEAQLKDYARQIQVHLLSKVINAQAEANSWKVLIENSHGEKRYVQAEQVINATYSGSNAVNRLFGVRDIDLMHEIAEMVFVSAPSIQNLGLTVMDGQFGSIMPYGLSGLHSLSSVAYTHHKVSYDALPTFNCQDQNPSCRPDFTGVCNACPAQPPSNYRKMLSQIRLYFSEQVELHYFNSMFTIKSKLKANYIDDGRPTEISILRENPRFYCIFAGKINSIYEIEKALT